jgi:Holliday junction resolvase RusA-like endonuclease
MNHTIKIKPLSVNEAFKGKKYRTDKYDLFIKNMMFLLPNNMNFPDEKNIKIAIIFGFSSSLSDIDNCCKSFLDCLVKKYKIDDRYIYEMHVFKEIVIKGQEFITFKIY